MNANYEDELIRQFEDCSLPLEALRHCVHIEIAYLYLRKYALLDVLARFPAALTRYAEAHGKKGLYHETITWAYILLIHERMQRAGHAQSWDQFKTANPDLLSWTATVLKQYYRDETLSSDLARKIFLFPDKVPVLPFQNDQPHLHSRS
jgi:hypothetical protein